MTTLRFSHGTGIAGSVVRWATWSDFAHIGFKLPDGRVLDATPEFGVAVHYADDDETTQYWKILAPTKYIDGMVEWGMTQVGKPYDWGGILGWAFRRDWHDDRHWDCSEFVAGASDAVHWPLVRDCGKLTRISPRDIAMSTRIERILR